MAGRKIQAQGAQKSGAKGAKEKVTFALTPPEPKDTRFSAFKDYIFRMFRWAWDCDPRWGPMEARQLKSLLEENPTMTDRDFALALKKPLHVTL